MAFPFLAIDYPYRRGPREYVEDIGWINQHGHKKQIREPYHHFVWPKDGKNGSKFGRFKDILTGKGPDIHIAISAEKGEYMHNRLRKSRWSRHTILDDRDPDGSLSQKKTPWIKSRGDQAYDFRTRTYRSPYRHMWTDAIWNGARGKHPSAYRNVYGDWRQQHPNAEEIWWVENFGSPRAFA